MKLDNEILQYLNGEKFSNALKVNFSQEKTHAQTRINRIEEIVQGKSVIHLGCADHKELIDTKIMKGNWLHDRLLKCTSKCVGIDINQESIEYLKEKYNIPDIHCFNIEKDAGLDEIIGTTTWDYLIMGEIIEHVNNPVAFLENIHSKFQRNVKHIIITAPNVLNIYNAKMLKKGIEIINSDHRYWFSPYTLTKVLLESGFNDFELNFVEHTFLPFHLEVKKHILRRLKLPFKLYASYFASILIVANFNSGQR